MLSPRALAWMPSGVVWWRTEMSTRPIAGRFRELTAARPLLPARVPWWWAVLLMLTSGFTLRLAFPEPGLWWAAPIAIVVWLTALNGRGFWAGSALSLLGGVAFWLSLIHWLTLYLGPLPWAALGVLMAVYMAVAGGAIAWLMRWVPRLWPGELARLLGVPALVASIWVAREWFAMTWPYGGFSWGRIAMSQTEGLFAALLSWLGATGLSWLIVALATLAFQLLATLPTPNARRLGRFRLNPWWWLAFLAVGAAAVPLWPTQTAGDMRVLAVQGGVDASLFTDLPPGSVLAAQANATLKFRGADPDVVVWPENGADVDPLRSGASAAVLNTLSEQFDAPLLVGTITVRDDMYFNSSLLWRSPAGLIDWYDKARPVPFAEYMPDRALWRPFAPDLIDLIGRDYQAGTRSNVLDIDGVRSGVAICFDIAFDEQLASMMQGGAQIIFAQTNNADFGHTDESVQQLAIARMRALESGRVVVNISTVGSSAIIGADGRSIDELPTWTPGGMLQTVPLATGATAATIVGGPLSVLAVGFGVAGLLLALLLRLLGGAAQATRSSPRRERSQSKRS